jgi:hypothetical protein
MKTPACLLDRPGTPFEPRLKCAVGNCCLPTYSGIHEHMLTHCFPNFIPGWNQYGDHQDIAAMIAPRALHLNFGELDGSNPASPFQPLDPCSGSRYRLTSRKNHCEASDPDAL